MENKIYWKVVDETIINGKIKCCCICGNESLVNYNNFKRGLTKSCGCIKYHELKPLNEYHGYKNGDKINRLTIIDDPIRKKVRNGLNKKTGKSKLNHVIHLKCKCDCGNIIERKGLDIIKGLIKSCGCTNLGQRKIGSMPRFFYRYLLVQAKQRNIYFNISFEDLSELFDKQNGKCNLSDVPIKFSSNSKENSGNASLDRINSDKPYTIDNVQWVHVNVNYAKLSMSNDDFILMCKQVANKFI
jgi:hypothetical protein